jgi:hypothetical protein
MRKKESLLSGKQVDEDTIHYILNNFKYNEDGSLTRYDRKNSGGSYDKDGYLIIKIKGRQYKAHRIVYLLNHNKLPNGEIDHINRNRSDNRIENLRVVTRKVNIRNTTKKPNEKTGVVGVHIDNTNGLKKNFATSHKGKTYRFSTLEEAYNKRQELLNNER